MYKPKVCAVSFLNTAPLVYGMTHGPQHDAVDLQFAVPSECARRVSSGAADVGLVPVIEMVPLVSVQSQLYCPPQDTAAFRPTGWLAR